MPAELQYRISGGRQGQRVTEPGNPVSDFIAKLHLAWSIFFPEAPKPVSPKDAGKQRLRMILVADRCGMSPASLSEMKKTIVCALSDFVDIDDEEQVDVTVTVEPEMGTMYCVAVPITRVKPEARHGFEGEGDDGEGLPINTPAGWDPEDWNSDPSGQFPYGT